MRPVLVVTNAHDVTADYLLDTFRNQGQPYFRLNTADIPQAVQVELRLGAEIEARIITARDELRLADVQSIWWRRPVPPELPADVPSRFRAYLANEAAAAAGGILRAYSGLWVNHPDLNNRAEFKPFQLAVAKHVGWQVPRSLISGRPDVVQHFISESPEAPIIKAIDHGFVEASDGETFSAYTRQLTAEDLAAPAAVTRCPVFLQERVPRFREHRITVVGNAVFSTVIASRDGRSTAIDWRALKDDELDYLPADLPDIIRDRCLRTVRTLGLHFGALDVIERPDGEFVFLEINPNGQWAWLEMKTGQPIRQSFVDLLCGSAPS